MHKPRLLKPACYCRVSQLEEEVRSCRSQLQQCQGELAGKEADNVSLYEKIRYLQRYSSNRQASSSDSLINVVQVDDAGVAQPQVMVAMMANLSVCRLVKCNVARVGTTACTPNQQGLAFTNSVT